MITSLFRAFLAVFTAAALAVSGLAYAAEQVPAKPVETFDDQARFLAGLPVSDSSPLKALEESKEWQDYAKSLEADWGTLRERRLGHMIEWSGQELRQRIDTKANLFYFFGGPDLISVLALYPEAPVYLLCGLEPIGQVPQVSVLKKPILDRAMANLRKSLNTTVRASFFKTSDMAGDLTRTELRGVLPLLYLFAARSDAQVLDVKMIEIASSGEARDLASGEKPGKGVPGVRMRIQRKGQEKTQEIFYVRQNVENDVLARTPGFLAFHKRYAPGNAFFKAASFILHDTKRFSKTRDFVLENSLSVLQDDSGVPFHSFGKDTWSLALYGRYLRPLPPFGGHYQDELVKAFNDGQVRPLPFVTGYRHPGESNLVLATKTRAQAEQAAPKAEELKPAMAGPAEAKPDVKPAAMKHAEQTKP